MASYLPPSTVLWGILATAGARTLAEHTAKFATTDEALLHWSMSINAVKPVCHTPKLQTSGSNRIATDVDAFTLSIMYWSQHLSFLYTKMEVRFPFVYETLDPIQTIRVLYQRSHRCWAFGQFLSYSTRNSLPRSSKLFLFPRRGRLDSSKISQWLFWSNCSNRIEYWVYLDLSLQHIITAYFTFLYLYIYILIVDIVYCIEMLTYTTTDYMVLNKPTDWVY